MNSAKEPKKPPKMTPSNNKNKMFNDLVDMIPGWTDSTFASGKKFLELLWETIWKVTLYFLNKSWAVTNMYIH